MKRLSSVTLFLSALFILFAFAPRQASADSITLTFTGVGGASSGGYYIYPYLFTVQDGSKVTDNVALMCISFDKHITVPETWTVDRHTAGSLGVDYEKAAYLLDLASTNPTQASNAQWAAWYLFDKTDVSLTGDISALLADAALAVGANPDKYGLYEIYVPTVDLGAETPQTFIGPPEVPEPSPLLLLGSAMLGLSLLLYFRKHNVHSLNLG